MSITSDNHMLTLLQRLPGAIFPQDYARPHTTRVSQDCLRTVTTLPWPDRSPDFLQSRISGILRECELGILRV
ncbi:hypothetical protein TNCV_420001 [Trichonephila clavipes]|uniref:Uncharacterized protein n=1 Tax=Trichonephila clavipes TaxID=2585209 RepID=A0A8X6SA56_TRICX|nr:hypothetical protein TNCV_420001 [Trichonephila clavipes]